MLECTCLRLSHMQRLYVCNVIKAGMSKWAKYVQILVNDKSFKDQKACLVEIEQTARKLETYSRANFLMADNMAYQLM